MKNSKKEVAKVEVVNEVQVVNLTQKENLVLNELIFSLSAEAGFSDVDCNDLAKSTKLAVSVVKGLIGSLVKKDLVFTSKTETLGAKQYEIVYLAPFAWGLHPDWKIEAEHSISINVIDEDKTKSTTVTNAKKSSIKLITEEIIEKAIEIVEIVEVPAKKSSKVKSLQDDKIEAEILVESANTVNKPYSVYGLHGKNVDLEDFQKGDRVEFKIADKTEVGEFVHFHINNWSKNGYAVIKFNGKIYERVLASISKVAVEVVKKSTKKDKLAKV